MRFSAHALIATTVLLSACGKETPTVSVSEPTTTQNFLEGVPADTAFLSASVTPAPLEKLLPWAQTLDDAAMPSADKLAEMLADPELKVRKRRALALLGELTGHYTPEGLRELGFSSNPRVAMYGVGLLPAAKIEIEDSAKVGAFIERVFERGQISAKKEQRGDATVWTFEASRRKKRTAVVVLEDGLLRLGVATADTAEILVAELLEPTSAESLSEVTVTELADRWGMQSYSIGFVDLEQIARTVLGDGDGLNGAVWAKLRPQSFEITDACKRETLAVTQFLPRAVFGSEDWSANALGFGGALEMRSDLPTRLAATKVGAPLATAPDAIGVMGIGFSVGNALNVLRDGATQITNRPFECSWYGAINRGAEALSSRWAMLPPALQQIEGATIVVKDLHDNPSEDAGPPFSLDAIAAFGTKTPEGLVDLAAGFDTTLEGFRVPAIGDTAPIPNTHLTKRLVNPKMLRSANAVAISTGEWSGAELTALDMTATPVPFLHLRYDAESIANRLGFEGDVAPIRAALRGKSSLTIEPQEGGIRVRTTYERETGEE